MTAELNRKRASAVDCLHDCGSVVVALSGGVDSAVLLVLALEALGRERVLAATGLSPSFAGAELVAARQVALALRARHELVETREIDKPAYRANAGDRCFHCRSELFERLARLGRERGLNRVVYGAIVDDLGDVRPGMRAAGLCGVVAPLLEAGLTKEDVRRLAREASIPVADKPAAACLASRIPVGIAVTPERLQRVERAEAALRELGFVQFRVRHHEEVARLELDEPGLRRLDRPEIRREVDRAVRCAGYRFVTVDLAGYRSGSLALAGEERSADETETTRRPEAADDPPAELPG